MSDAALAKVLIERQLLPVSQVENLVRKGRDSGSSFATLLLESGHFTRPQILQILENHYFCQSIDLQSWEYDPDVLAHLPINVARKCIAFPVREQNGTFWVAFTNPDNTKTVDLVRQAIRHSVTPIVALRGDIESAIDIHYGRFEKARQTEHGEDASAAGARESKESHPEAEPIVFSRQEAAEVVATILEGSVRRGATDIHIEPAEEHLLVRYRVDGILHRVAELPRVVAASTLSRIKVLGEMDIAEKRVPQDGRYSFKVGEDAYDCRISSLPTQFGEKIVIRLLKKNLDLLDLEKIQMPASVRKPYQEVLDRPQGFFLVTGPTGSGKTTTLYATLASLDRVSLNISTLEDPIEYTLPGLSQTQINETAGMTFTGGLRALLRQDPDVILVGEIRDADTVSIACRAALTGHKVLSTLHTNDAPQAVTRLIDMGVAPYLIGASLQGVLAQRLIRRNCDKCKEAYPASDMEVALLNYPVSRQLWRGRGCHHCANTGYKGRQGIYEYFHLDGNIQRLLLEGASSQLLRRAAQQNGMVGMGEFARHAALEGITTVAEIQRAVLSSESMEQVCEKCSRVVNSEYSVCPFCQHILKERCPHCGESVEATWEACPKCGQELELESQQVYCPHCLAVVEHEWDVCPYCGEDL